MSRSPARPRVLTRDGSRYWEPLISTPGTAAAPPSTPTFEAGEWAIDDEVIRLRELGSGRIYPLFPDEREPRRIGTAAGAEIRIEDPTRRVSRQHAHIERTHGRWVVVDDASRNGMFIDGARRDRAGLVPGTEIGVGGVTLIAESARLIALRAGVARLLGWAASQAEAVDRALRSIRLAGARRSALVLCGRQELEPLAAALHELTLTTARPFVVCHPGGPLVSGLPFRSATTGMEALAAAWTGTLCLLHTNLPPDLFTLMTELRRPDCQAQLVVLANDLETGRIYNSAPVIVPDLDSRKSELGRLIEEYEGDATKLLRMKSFELSAGERAWIRVYCAGSLADIQRATLRLVAIHRGGSISAGGNLIGISHTAMLKWVRTRKLPRRLLGV